MQTTIISVIIPVYNDEKRVRRCLDSILVQTFKNFECVIIDDGSIDNSPVICDEFAKNESRFRVLHKKNEGTSKARQLGIIQAKGEFIVFVDSDDWVEPSFLSNIFLKMEDNKTELLFMDFTEENKNGIENIVFRQPASLDCETIIRLVLEGKLYSCLWNIAVKKDFYLNNNINFTDGVNYGEDSLFIIELLLNSPVIHYLSNGYYHHTYNFNSFTNKNIKQRYLERSDFHSQLSVLLNRYDRNDLNKNNFFPMNDKYEILYRGILSKNEYQNLFSPEITIYYLKRYGIKKYIMLYFAETIFYTLVKNFILFNEYRKNKIASFFHKKND